MIFVTPDPIDIPSVLRAVADPRAGGIDVFIGTTRNHANGKEVIALEYEAYEPMALKELQRVVDETRSKWDVVAISVVHRVGRVPVGEASIVIAVSAAHRDDAFSACRHIIDTLKRTVPIWKKEFYRDGEVWVGQHGQPMQRSDEM
jgi:molybdopterin synthase catalytic subunit